MIRNDFHINNFDLLRLLASLQVVFFHAKNHLNIQFSNNFLWVSDIVELFPGVLIFFFISGFLLSRSFGRNPNLVNYSKNRLLRIYPGLYVCFFFSVLVLIIFGQFDVLLENYLNFFFWSFAQLSILQFFNPNFLRDFGVGVLNGSLWTISVEIQFYILLPFIFHFVRIFSMKEKEWMLLFLLILLSSSLFFVLESKGEASQQFFVKLTKATAAPHLFMFVIGVWLSRTFDKMYYLIEGKVLVWFGIYLTFSFLIRFWGYSIQYNYVLMIVSYFILSFFILSFAFSFKKISQKVLKGQDISYGIYLYHMIIINVFVELGFSGKFIWFGSVYLITIFLGILSWRLVEVKALKLKNISIRKVVA